MADTKVITGLVRFSYVHVFEPQAANEDAKPKYSVSILIPKIDTQTLTKIRNAQKAAAEAGKAKLGGKVPKSLKMPLRDGDEDREDDPAYADHYFINASSLRRPQIVDSNLDPIMDREEFYSGCYGRASVNFYAFNVSGNKGVAAGLNNIQKLKEGEPLAGGSSAVDDFGDAEDLDIDDDDLEI